MIHSKTCLNQLRETSKCVCGSSPSDLCSTCVDINTPFYQSPCFRCETGSEYLNATTPVPPVTIKNRWQRHH